MIEAEIRALEAERRAAMLRGDADCLASLLDQDAVYYPGAGGRQSASAMVESVRNGGVRYLDIGIEDEDIVAFPGAAIVTGLLIMRVLVAGEEILNRRRFVDVWILRPEGWRLGLYHGVMVDTDSGEIQAEINAGIRRALAGMAGAEAQ